MSIKNFLNLFSKKCINTKVFNFRIISRPNPYVYNLQWDAYGLNSNYVINVRLPNGMFWDIQVSGNHYQLIITDPNGRHEISIKKKCSCASQSVSSDVITINPCANFPIPLGSGNMGNTEVEAGTGFHLLKDWVNNCKECSSNPVTLWDFKKTNLEYKLDGIIYSNSRVGLSINISRHPDFQMISGEINIYPIGNRVFGLNSEIITPIKSGQYPKILNATLFNNVGGYENLNWVADGLNSSLIDDNHCVAEWDIIGKLNGQIISLNGCKIIGEIIGNIDYTNTKQLFLTTRITSSGISQGQIISSVPNNLLTTSPIAKGFYVYNTIMGFSNSTGINLTISLTVFGINGQILSQGQSFINIVSQNANISQFILDSFIDLNEVDRLEIEAIDNNTGESETLTYQLS